MPKSVLAFVGPQIGYMSPSGGPIPWSTGGSGGSGLLGGTLVQDQYDRPGYQMRFENRASGAAPGGATQGGDMRCTSLGLGGVTTAIIVDRFYATLDQFPNDPSLWGGFANNGLSPARGFALRLLPSGYLEHGYLEGADFTNDPYTNPQLSLKQLCPQKWYRIDRILNVSGSTWTVSWQINGEDQTQVALGGQTAVTWDAAFIGHGVPAVDRPLSTTVMFACDWGVTNDAAQYPLGPARSQIVLVEGFGTNSNPAAFSDESGGAITSTAWHRVRDDAPPLQDNVTQAAANDGLSLRAFGPFDAANYLEFVFEDLNLDPGQQIIGVQAWFEMYRTGSSGVSPSILGRLRISTPTGGGGNKTGAFGGAATVQAEPWNTTATGELLRAIPSPGGGTDWTEADFNTIYCRFGSNSNAAGDPATAYYGLSWLCLEVQLTSDAEPYPVGCPAVGDFDLAEIMFRAAA